MQQSLWAGSRNDPVNRTALQENDKAKMMTVTSGQKCLESFKKFNRPGLLAKTFPALLIGQKGWYSKKCNLIWRLKATRYNHLYFQLQVSVPRTEETESGLLPTPTAMTEAESKMKSTQQKEGSRHSVGLGSAMVMGLLPTPQAIDGCGTGRDLRQKKDSNRDLSKPGSWRGDLKDFAFKGMLPTPRANKVNGCNLNSENLASRGKGNLEESVAQWVVGMLPTPAARDYKGGRNSDTQRIENGKVVRKSNIPDVINEMMPGQSSQLNHRFVMEMMGFPPTWCDIYYELAEIAIQKKRQKKKPKG